jgi:DNA-directed RNA polymerase specialized sigma24 family protein
MNEGSITGMIGEMRAGDTDAARRIWDRYSARLVALARERLPTWLRQVVDGDDVANNAFQNLVVGSREGRFPGLRDRDDLWAQLAMITVRKAINEVKWACRQRRPPPQSMRPLGEAMDREVLPPDLEVMAAEEFDTLIERLRRKDAVLAEIALWKFEGSTHEEIALRLGCSCRKVARKLELIRMYLAWEGREGTEGRPCDSTP